MDGIRRSYVRAPTDSGISVWRFESERDYFRHYAQQCCQSVFALGQRCFPVCARQNLAESNGASDKCVLSLLHSRVNRCDSLRENRIVVQPIDEQHRVPVDAAHSWSSASRKDARSARREASPPPYSANTSLSAPRKRFHASWRSKTLLLFPSSMNS